MKPDLTVISDNAEITAGLSASIIPPRFALPDSVIVPLPVAPAVVFVPETAPTEGGKVPTSYNAVNAGDVTVPLVKVRTLPPPLLL